MHESLDRPAAPALNEYALLSDCQGSALVSLDGSIDWACLPRFDSSAVFARLLDPAAGHWRIAPTGEYDVRRAYLDGTMVLETRFTTPAGEATLTDALSLGIGEQGHMIGRHAPHVVVRRVAGVRGTVEMDLELAPRPEFGLTVPALLLDDDGLRTKGGPHSHRCWSPVPLTDEGGCARARFTVQEGETVCFGLAPELLWGDDGTATVADFDLDALLTGTIDGWRSWVGLHQSYEGPYCDLVHHSGRVLQALTYAPTGAVVAAPTTSLPETPGGERNWDYRYCWVRDASLTLEALWVAACPDEAAIFFDFLATAAGGNLRSGTDLQILYGIGAERLVPEHELDHLAGFGGSRPVRIGNGAWNQTQSDVYGELLGAACLLADTIGEFDPATARFLVDTAELARRRWEDPDQGIWEVRGPARHYVHSKLMCWVALDRAIELAPRIGADDRVEQWSEARAEIRAAIEDRGWSDELGAFVQAFDEHSLDASTLALIFTGFLEPDDPRARATVEAIARDLTDERGCVYRYRNDDGLSGGEGTFVVCTFWLARCLAIIGETGRARELFEHVTAQANDVGLLAEELDPATGALWGNFPQAFSHIGLVNAAWAIAQAEGAA